MIKVLMQNRAKNRWNGGDWVQLERTAEALRRLGVQVDINEDMFITPPEKLKDYDIIHLFNFSMVWTKYQLWCARKWKKPVVCSMIYHENDEFVPYNLQQVMMNELSCAIFQTKGELERAKRHIEVPDDKVKFIGNGIEKWWLEKSDKVIPQDPFVLTVGRIEPSKGMLACAKACKQLKVPYICIGSSNDPEYVEEVRKQGAIILPFMTKEELKPYYYTAKVYCQPSSAETWGLCIDEASSQGTPCVLTSKCERDDYPFIRCEFDNVVSIKKAIQKAWTLPKSYTHAKNLKTWDKVAVDLLKIYQEICKK